MGLLFGGGWSQVGFCCGDRFFEDAQIPDVVCQEQYQPRVEERTLLVAQVTVRFDQHRVEVVTGGIVVESVFFRVVEVGLGVE